jgi:hypothetical protein
MTTLEKQGVRCESVSDGVKDRVLCSRQERLEIHNYQTAGTAPFSGSHHELRGLLKINWKSAGK